MASHLYLNPINCWDFDVSIWMMTTLLFVAVVYSSTSSSGHSIDEDAFTRALLQYRNTNGGLSHTQKLYGRPVQDMLPAHHRSFQNNGKGNLRTPGD